MGDAERSLFDMLAERRARLRTQTLPTLTAALVLQIRIACASDRSDLRALSSAFGIVVLIALALAAETVAAIAAGLTSGARDLARTRVRFGPARAAVLTPQPINEEMLVDKRGRPLRGAPRAKRLAALERQRAEAMALAAAALAGARRVIELPPPPRRVVVAYESARRVAVGWIGNGVRAYAFVTARLGAALGLIPIPAMPIRSLRIVATTTALTFVFATTLGTTGIITQQGRIALGASTTLSVIAGEVMAQDPGSSDLRPVADGALLRAGMTIRTSANAYAVLTYFEGSTVSLEPNTTVVIEQLIANPDGSTVIALNQQLGRTWHSVTKLLGQSSKYEVRTPTLTATVRGTAFEVGVVQAASGEVVSSVVTTEGAVAASKPPTPADPTPAEVIVAAGFQTQAATTTPVAPPEPAPEPERRVTVTVGASNAVVVDPVGRANGERDGKLVLQTPGAKVTKVDGKLVITLPNIPDGRISTVVQPAAASQGAVSVATLVAERGGSETRSEEAVQVGASVAAVSGIEMRRGAAAQPAEVRVLAPQENQSAPAPKVAEAPRPTPRPEIVPSTEKKAEPVEAEGSRVSSVAEAFVRATLPPLSIEEAARRAEEARKAEERAKEETARREEQRRKDLEQRAAELREAEERAKQEAARLEAERRRAEEQARTAPPPAPPSGFVDNIIRAVAVLPGPDRAQDLRRAEDRAKEEAARLEAERRKAEDAKRTDDIRLAEAARKAAEQRAGELGKAADKARTDVSRELERLREIEAKAREQAQQLEAQRRTQAEKLLEEFRKAEEAALAEATKRIEEQRQAEERAKADAERRLAQLREEQERAKQEAARAEEERRREEQRVAQEKADKRESKFVPPTLEPLPGTPGRGGSGRP